jgi:hypothetical protein
MKNSTYAEMDAQISRLCTRIVEKDVEIERLRAALRWRPIVDAPTSQMILACCLDDKEYELIELIIIETSGRIFNVNSGNYSRSVFSHWMPLPDAPHKEALG